MNTIRMWAAPMAETLARLLGVALGILISALLVIETTQVILRYFFSVGVPWARDVSTLGLMWMAWLGAPLLWLQRAHLAVDFIPMPKHPAWQFFGQLILHVSMAVGALILIWYALESVALYAPIEITALYGASANLKFFPMIAGGILLFFASLLTLLRTDGQND